MEVLGAIGLAPCFHTGGKLGQKLFDPDDLTSERRVLNDRILSLDHFEVKLLQIEKNNEDST